MIRTCSAPGCSRPARRRYCGDECASADRQRRYRERECGEFVFDEISITVTLASNEPQAFGVATSSLVAHLFADDRARFRAMGYGHRRRHTPIPRIDAESAS